MVPGRVCQENYAEQIEGLSSITVYKTGGYLEKEEFSFKIKACEKFNSRHMFDIPRIKF